MKPTHQFRDDLVEYSSIGSDGQFTVAADDTPVLVVTVAFSALPASDRATCRLFFDAVTADGKFVIFADACSTANGGWQWCAYADGALSMPAGALFADMSGKMHSGAAVGYGAGSSSLMRILPPYTSPGYPSGYAALNGNGDLEISITVLSTNTIESSPYNTGSDVTFRNFRVQVETRGGV